MYARTPLIPQRGQINMIYILKRSRTFPFDPPPPPQNCKNPCTLLPPPHFITFYLRKFPCAYPDLLQHHSFHTANNTFASGSSDDTKPRPLIIWVSQGQKRLLHYTVFIHTAIHSLIVLLGIHCRQTVRCLWSERKVSQEGGGGKEAACTSEPSPFVREKGGHFTISF